MAVGHSPIATKHPSSVTRSRAGISRYLFAILLMLGFGFFNVESLIADVCDGDANRIAVTTVAGAQENGSNGSQPPLGHAVHVCHCMHAHGGIPARIDDVAPTPEIQALVAEFSAPAIADPALELELRPPIA
jgi:hypothetical protein